MEERHVGTHNGFILQDRRKDVLPEAERRLAAIMFTDMVGFTALGQRNETLALALVNEHRKVVRSLLPRHNGKEVKTVGDGFLIMFPNALDATRCSYDLQRAIREFNLSLPEHKRANLRVGLHLGDVVETKRDVSGDAVNVASRIEPLAEEGGVCLTRQVYDLVCNKFQVPMESLGLKSLKNVDVPMEVFKMVMPWESKDVQVALPERLPSPQPGRGKKRDSSLGKFFEKIEMKDRITVIKIRNSRQIPETLMKFSQGINYDVGETFHITSVTYSVSVAVDSKNVDKLTRLIPRKDILAVYPRLAEITISLPDEALFVPGIVGVIGKELSSKGVNILEYFTSTPEQIIIVDETNALKAYQILRSISA